MTDTTCTHPDASAARGDTPCGEPETWYCETIGGCGGTFVITKPHAVVKFTLHAEGCDRRHLPADWCGCAVRKVAGCINCDREFPRDVESGPDVDVFA